MKKTALLVLTLCILLLSGCTWFEIEKPMSKDEARTAALTCFEEHQTEMQAIIRSEKAMGDTAWCNDYGLLSDGEYEFVLQRTGFTGSNTKTGVLYLPDDTPDSTYAQAENDPDVYSYTSGYTDTYFLERMEKNWFYFYFEYDF